MDIVQNIQNNTECTLTELERILGFPKSSMRKWSENIPSIGKVAKVAEYLNVSLDVLYYGKETNAADEQEQELINIFREIPEASKREVIAFAKGILCASQDNDKA